MIRTLAVLALVACAFGNVIQPRNTLPDGRIVGGVETSIEENPHQVSVRLGGGHSCGGSIIAPNKVLTAAHCCGYPASLFTIQYGLTKKGGSVNVIPVAKVIRHPGYNSKTIDNDVCVLVLSSEIAYSKVAQPIKLAAKEPRAGEKAVVTGWGTLSESGSSPSILQTVGVDITDREDCNLAYKAYDGVTPNMLCAGVPMGGKDACQGDSGGPLVVDDVLVGVVSWGVGCARPDFPGVYANVAPLQDWINAQ